ncbi:MAG: hypothetical protein KDN18_21220 [Verrucomicrobiae bacterium]|nr:hypothetical protein [Verrucomicrobiae bacterium]
MKTRATTLRCFLFVAAIVSAAAVAEGDEVVFEQSSAATGSALVAPYPSSGTDFSTWFSSGSPGAWIVSFTPTSNEPIRSVTLEMDDADPQPTSGGFSLTLGRLVAENSVIRFEIVSQLEGSANPSTAGSYTYLVPDGIEARGAHSLLAMVDSGGGTFRWKLVTDGTPQIGSGGVLLITTTDQPVTDPFGGDLNLEKLVLFNNAGNDNALFSVVAADRFALISLSRPKRFQTTSVGDSSRPQKLRITNSGAAPALLLGLRVPAQVRRNFRISKLPPRTLAAGASKTSSIAFRPHRPGAIRGSLFVTHSTGVAKVTLRGRGK